MISHDVLAVDSAVSSAVAVPNQELLSEVKALWGEGLVPADARGFLSSHPELRADRSVVLDLAYEEYCVRTEQGEPVDPDAFCEQFPTFKTSLRELIFAHQILEKDGLLPARERPLSWPEPGERFLRFTLLRELGRGTFGRVFLATEGRLGDRPVAVKVSIRGGAEAETLGRLRHPNIIPVYSVDEDSGLTAVCMPYAGRATLRDLLDWNAARPELPSRARAILEAAQDGLVDDLAADRPPPAPMLEFGSYVDGICHLAVQLAEALAFAHTRGVYHRDLKPSNVLLTSDGKPLLLDFNLAFDARRADRRLGGTLPYMAPEQLRAIDPLHPGNPTAVDARSDLFSLGVIVYELLAGKHPFGSLSLKDGAEQVRTQLLERQRIGPEPLRRANAHVDAPLARVVQRCLAFDPKDRPQNAAELVAAFRGSLSRFRRVRRRLAQHSWAGLTATLLTLAAGVGGGYAMTVRTPPHVAAVKAGAEAYRAEQYSEAAEQFTKALAAVEENPWVWYARGRAHLQQAVRGWVHQDREVSTALFKKALGDFEEADRRTKDGRILFCLGVCQSYLLHHEEAIQQYRCALDRGFQPAEIYNNVGFSYYKLAKPEELSRGRPDDLKEARHFLDQAQARNVNLSATYHNRAIVGFRQALRSLPFDNTLLDLAIEDIRQAVPLGLETAELYLDAARIFALATRGDAGWAEEAQRFGQLAIREGQKPEIVEGALWIFWPKPLLFPPLAKTPARAKPLKALRIADPLTSLPAELLPTR